MRERNIEYHLRLNDIENDKLEELAMQSKLSKSDIIRKLILENEIKEKPDKEFYKVMNELSKIGINLNQIATKVNSTNEFDKEYYKEQVNEIKNFTSLIKEKYLYM